MYFVLTTFGCKVNQYESAGVREFMKRGGFTETDRPEAAAVHIVNSCTVTENSDKKVRRLISAIKNANPNTVTVLCGCFAKAFPDKAKATGADIIIEGALPVKSFSAQLSKTRAFLKIGDGCNRNCAYCIIPKARGEVRNRDLSDITSEARKLADHGHKEIVLTAVNLGLFTPLFDAVRAVCEIDKIRRVRLSSLEPDLINGDLIAKLSELPKFCPHFHISLQSGSDAVLRRMNRRYDTDYYSGLVGTIRKYFPDSAVTTDIIAGFPGETEAEFAETLNFAENINFAKIHAFAYSKRGGTAAAEMPNQIPDDVKRARIRRLCDLALKMRADFFKSMVGSIQETLIEADNTGHTRNYAPVKITDGDFRKNDIAAVRITGYDDNQLKARKEYV